MRAGSLRHRVTIDGPVLSQGDTGEEVVAWTTDATGSLTVWADVSPLSGKEQLQASQVLANVTTRIRIRWSPTNDQITPKWRVRHAQDIYNIVFVNHVNLAQREIELMCESGRNNG